ncbi:MAG: heme-binding protein [Proteobacteria bacterium]|nr:heme-binding protein [Pseudomonadota bacterium]
MTRRPFTCLLAALAALVVASAAAAPAAPTGTLRVTYSIAETSFDPAFGNDAASDGVISNVFDTLLDYDYLARPVKLVPRLAEALPVVSDNGATYTFKLRHGVYFHDDPAFGGKRREVTAADVVYSYERHLDPAKRSPWASLLEGRLVGGDEAQDRARKSGTFDYDTPFAGLEAVDRYTFRLRLKVPDYRFAYVVAMPALSILAREVVERYGTDIGAHPVGTGPYRLGEYKRSARIVLEANPGFRTWVYTPPPDVPAASRDIAKALAGKTLPRNARIEISIIEEGQSTWLAFLRGELDLIDTFPAQFTDQLLTPQGTLRPELAARGIQHRPFIRPNVWWDYFNMEDPMVGGYTPAQIALRRAIGMGFDEQAFIKVVLKGRALPAAIPIPPDVEGYAARTTNAQLYDPAAARALLDRFGYKDRDGDGYRERPDGSPLTVQFWSSPTSTGRQSQEIWKKYMDAIGVRFEFHQDRTPELRKMGRQGKIMMRHDGWNADYPDAENFMQNLYGGNIGQSNDARFRLPAYDELFLKARTLRDGPERDALFAKMTDLVLAYAPWRLAYYLLEDPVAQPRVRNFVPHPIRSNVWMYLAVDGAP